MDVSQHKKIVFYMKKFGDGGIESSLFQYLDKIDPALYEVTLVIAYKKYATNPLLQNIPAHIRIHFIIDDTQCEKNQPRIWSKLVYNLYKKPKAKFFLHQQLKQILPEFDVIVDYSLILGGLVKSLPGTKITFFHFRMSHHYKTNKVTRRYRRLLPFYDKIVVIAKDTLHDARVLFPDCKEKFVLIPNQFNFAKIQHLANSGEIEELMQEDYVLSAGRLAESQKDFTNLIYAYNLVVNQYKRPEKLLIIGDGVDKPKLHNLITLLALEDKVLLLGRKNNPFIWMKHAKAFILSSKHEGLPSVLIEALALDTPLISTDCPDGPKEILQNGMSGILVPVGDIAAMAQAIVTMLDNSEVRERYVDAGKTIKNNFNIDVNMNKLYALFADKL